VQLQLVGGQRHPAPLCQTAAVCCDTYGDC
jgi:hypothetical protein